MAKNNGRSADWKHTYFFLPYLANIIQGKEGHHPLLLHVLGSGLASIPWFTLISDSSVVLPFIWLLLFKHVCKILMPPSPAYENRYDF